MICLSISLINYKLLDNNIFYYFFLISESLQEKNKHLEEENTTWKQRAESLEKSNFKVKC